MRKLLRELRREFPFATIELTSGNHYRLTLPNHRTVIVSSTPSCRNTLRVARSHVRRLSKERRAQ
jgi:hypothetical protein